VGDEPQLEEAKHDKEVSPDYDELLGKTKTSKTSKTSKASKVSETEEGVAVEEAFSISSDQGQSTLVQHLDEGAVEDLEQQSEVASKLDLAMAYERMDNFKMAKKILKEVIKKGTDEQIDEAKALLKRLK